MIFVLYELRVYLYLCPFIIIPFPSIFMFLSFFSTFWRSELVYLFVGLFGSFHILFLLVGKFLHRAQWSKRGRA